MKRKVRLAFEQLERELSILPQVKDLLLIQPK